MAKKASPVKRRRRAPAKKTRTRRKKTMMSKISKFASPAGIGLGFLGPYLKRSKETGTSVIDLIKADIENFDSAAASERVKTALPGVGVTIGAGVVLKEMKLLGAYNKLASDLILGFGVGTLGKSVLDPPTGGQTLQRGGRIVDMQRQANGGYAMRNPYEGGY